VKKFLLLAIAIASSLFFIISCKKDSPNNNNTNTTDCSGVNISVSTTKVDPDFGQKNGSITVTASPAGTYTYSINSGAFQSSNVFSGLGAGTYVLVAKNSTGCSSGKNSVTLSSTNPCTNTNIVINAIPTAVIPCPNTPGSITVNASGSTGFTYNKNGGSYQSSNLFSSLTAGTYTIGVKDVNGCTNTATVTVGTAAAGPLFTAVKNNIIVPSCVRCHGNSGGCNLNSDCNIVSYANRINVRCVTQATTNPMPPSGAPSATLRTQITNWINAGGRYTD